MVLMPAMMELPGRVPGNGSSDGSCAPAAYVLCTFRTAWWRCKIGVLWSLDSRLPEVGAGWSSTLGRSRQAWSSARAVVT
jgi:hypothetical protein